VREVEPGQKITHLLDVPRQPEVVVAEIADDLALGFLQRRVPVKLAVARALRVVEPADARIGSGQLVHQFPRHVRGAVPDDPDLEVGDSLRQGALHRVPQRRPVVVRRDEDGRGGHQSGPGDDRRVRFGTA
jgi:hypothetical protein